MCWWERVVAHECPSELGRCDLRRSTSTRREGHPLDATIPRSPRDHRAVRRSEPRVVCRAGAGHGAGRPLRAGQRCSSSGSRSRRRAAPTPRRRSSPSSPGWCAARTRSTTWTCCATAACPGCSTGVRAPSTLGTFLRLFTFGHVRQLDAVAAGLLARLARRCRYCPAPSKFVLVDIDDTVRQTYGYAKQGAGRGYTGVKGLERAARDRLDPAARRR